MSIELIVGLGNPGSPYQGTRHNVGFAWIDALAEQLGARWSSQGKFFAELAQGQLAHRRVWLLKPTTFMNLSGKSVASLCQFYKLSPEQVLIGHDELALNPGVIKLKQGGGHNGHNGLKSIISCLGNQTQFSRLRIGIGHPGQANLVSDFVLGRPPSSERDLIEQAIGHALQHSAQLVSAPNQAMNQINGFKAT